MFAHAPSARRPQTTAVQIKQLIQTYSRWPKLQLLDRGAPQALVVHASVSDRPIRACCFPCLAACGGAACVEATSIAEARRRRRL